MPTCQIGVFTSRLSIVDETPGLALPGQTASVVGRAVANLLRLADADLKDAELLSSGRHPGNAPALLQLASTRLSHALLATEHGWPLAGHGADLTLVPVENPLKQAVANLVGAGGNGDPPTVADDGSLTTLPDAQALRTSILAARAVLKTLAATFEVDLFGTGAAGRTGPVRPAAVPEPVAEAAHPEPKPLPQKPVQARSPSQRAAVPPVAPPAEPPKSGGAFHPRFPLSVPKTVSAPVPPSHAVDGRASIEVKQAPASVASTPFWTLMERWHMPDQAALDLIGHGGGLTKKGTRPRFKLVGEEAALLKGFQEIDAALPPLGLAPETWLHQPIKVAPFDGATPALYLTRCRKQGVQDVLRFILQNGLRLSMANNR